VNETYIVVSAQGLIDVARRELVQFLVVAEDDDGDVDRTQHRQLVGFLEQAAFALEEGDGAVAVVLDRSDLNLPPSHTGTLSPCANK
jgi:hypothetical protein